MYDAIVVGLGPAGSTAARLLALNGLKVLGIDKEVFPRYKSCGGCISTKINSLLDFDISGVVENTIYGATFTYKAERELEIASDRPVGYNVMRDRFDHLLLEKAKEAGAEIIEGTRITGASDEGGHVAVRCASGVSYKGKFLVGADGSAGFIGRELFGLKPKECAVSITAEVPYDRSERDFAGRLFIDFGSVPFGYGWIFPKEKYLSLGIAGDVNTGGKIKYYFEQLAKSHPALNGLKIERRDGWSVPVYYDGADRPAKGRVVLAGDTGHLVDPFLGEGIYFAIKTAGAAASVIIDCMNTGKTSLDAYNAWIEKNMVPEFKAAGKLSGLIYNHPRLWYSILEKEPEIMQKYYDVVRGELGCGAFYDWVFSKIRSKPWKVIRRWIDSRFLPA